MAFKSIPDLSFAYLFLSYLLSPTHLDLFLFLEHAKAGPARRPVGTASRSFFFVF